MSLQWFSQSSHSSRGRPKLGALLVALGALAATVGGVVAVRAQAQTCRDTGNITVCGDTLVFESGGDFQLRGNIRIGPKGQPAVVNVTDMPSSFNFHAIDPTTSTAQFFHLTATDPNSGCADCLFGKVHLIGDPNPEPLFSTHYADDPTNANTVVAGRLFVDTANAKVSFPPAGGVPVFVAKGVPRSGPYLFDFNARGQMLQFYKGGGTTEEFSGVDAVFDLNAKTFNATVPLSLKLIGGSSTDNESLQVTLRAIWNQQGNLSGTVDGFKAKIAGLVVSAKSLVLRVGEFEAGQVDVSKADNPDVPNLDPTKPDLLFSFQKLVYGNNRWSIKGATVPINNWEFGDAFRMTNQTIGLVEDAAAQTLAFQFNSTMNFGAAASGTPVPITLKIGRTLLNGVSKPNFEAGLQNMTPKIGSLTLNLQGVSFAGNVGEDFYGLKATTFSLQWPANLGGQTAAGLTNFKLGIGKDKKIRFSLGAVNFGVPTIENSLLKMTLQGTADVIGDTPTITMTGNMTLKLTGNSAVGAGVTVVTRSGANVCAAPNNTTPNADPSQAGCLKRMEGTLSSFNFKIAGFGVALTNARLFEDGGFGVQVASLTLPSGVTLVQAQGGQGALAAPPQTTSPAFLGITVNGFAIDGTGKVMITGGGFEVRPISIGNFQFVGLKGSFLKQTDGTYVFSAGGKLPLPGIEPGANGPGISAQVTIRVNQQTSQVGGGVVVSFTAPAGLGIPIANTGMELTGITGGFDVDAGTVTIIAGMKANTILRIPPPLNIPIATVNGTTTLQVSPFKLTANAQLSILVFNVANATMKVGNNAAFNDSAPGFHVDVNITGLILQGGMKLDVGKLTVNGVLKTRVAASAFASLGIKESTFGPLPRNDINIASVTLAGGSFIDNRTGQNGKERFGLKGTVAVVGFDKSVFVDMSSGGGPDLIVIGIDNITPLNSAAVRANAAKGIAGYGSRRVGVNSVDGSEAVQDTIPIVLTQTTKLVAGILYPAGGAPTLRLVLPGGTELTKLSVNGTSQKYGTDAGNGQTYEGFQIADAPPGNYQLIVDNAPAGYTGQIEQVNQAPVVSIGSVSCNDNPVAGVTVLCNGANSSGSGATVNWTASDGDSPNAKVRVGFAPVADASSPIDYSQVNELASDLPLGAGSYVWNMTEVPTGKYKLVVIAEDDGNPAKIIVGGTLFDVTDAKAPAVPTGLTGIPQAGELSVRWNQNAERDLAGYEIGFGLVNDGQPDDAAHFIYTRNAGPKEIVNGTSNLVDAKLWGLDDNVDMYYSMRAYDQTGNFSAWAPMLVGKPWPLAPKAWTPTPNTTGNAAYTSIDVAFATPMVNDSFASAFTVVGPSGAVPGTVKPIYDLDGTKIVGASFQPLGGLAGNVKYAVTLKGGGSGVTAEDGRQMSGDYAWSFTTSSIFIHVPMISR